MNKMLFPFDPAHRTIAAILVKASQGTRRLKAGSELYVQGDAAREIFLVREGWLCLYVLLPDGRRQILSFVLKGEPAAFSLAMGEELDHSAVALTDIEVEICDRARLLALLRREPWSIEIVGRHLLAEHRRLRSQLVGLMRMTAKERVCRLLHEILLRRGEPADPEELRLPLTQEQIGDAVGLTSVHVSRTLTELRDEGVIDLRRGRLAFMDRDAFVRLSGLDSLLFGRNRHPPAGTVPLSA